MSAVKHQGADGRYLGFRLGDELFGVPIAMVREIIGAIDITRVPNSPTFVEGVVNLRGKIVPMVDLRRKYQMTVKGFTKETCFIIIDVEEKQIGVVVDSVSQVVDFTEDEVETSGDMGDWQNMNHLIGMGKMEDHVYILVDLSVALSKDQLGAVLQNSPDSVPEGHLEADNLSLKAAG